MRTKIITTLPDLARSAKLLAISVELEDVDCETAFGLSIQQGLRDNKLREVIDMIREQAKDNRTLVADMVGENTLQKIESL